MVMGTLSGLLMVLAYPTSRGQTVTDPTPAGLGAGSGGLAGTPAAAQAFGTPTSAPPTAARAASDQSAGTPSATTPVPTGATRSGPSTPSATPSRSPSRTPSPTPTATATATTFTGNVVQTQWGPVQVKVVVQNGRLVDVVALQYPGGNSHSDQINAYALPTLRTQALNAQSAAIDGVSGATLTSRGYISSLQSALDRAAA
jgi:uncharacterized protein with FMN-binding domain